LSFSLTKFRINHTRARTTDTDYGSLYVSMNDKAVMQPASKFLGNFEDGDYSFNTPQDKQIMTAQLMNNMLQAQSSPYFANISSSSQMIQLQPILNNIFDTGPFAVVPGINSVIK